MLGHIHDEYRSTSQIEAKAFSTLLHDILLLVSITRRGRNSLFNLFKFTQRSKVKDKTQICFAKKRFQKTLTQNN